MKTILIKVAITLFIRWLKKNNDISLNGLLCNLLQATTRTELITALECESTEDDINKIVSDIEGDTLGTLLNDLIGD